MIYMNEPTLLKLSGGYINPVFIKWIEPKLDSLLVSIEGKDRPLILKDNDADIVRAYSDSRSWIAPQNHQEGSGI